MPDSRREFLTGRAAAAQIEAATARAGAAILDELGRPVPGRGPTVRLETRAMACQWQVVLNPGDRAAVMHASDALDLVHHLETLMTVYRPDGHLKQLNDAAGQGPQPADGLLREAVSQAVELTGETGGCFDATSGPLVAAWRAARDDGRVPTDDELADALARTGVDKVRVDDAAGTIELDAGAELNLGAVGKGFAVHKAAEFLSEQGIGGFLMHGGASSVTARGTHRDDAGQEVAWPVGLRNPLLNARRMATVLLGDHPDAAARSLGTSGGNVQYFRLGGKRYGHILDPRTGRPAEASLSATALCKDAGRADALSTAAFVGGRDAAEAWCRSGRAGCVWTPPSQGRAIGPEAIGVPGHSLFWHDAAAETRPTA